jgi:hypothetical protein
MNDVVGHQIVFFFFIYYVFPPILYVFTTACRGGGTATELKSQENILLSFPNVNF